MRMMHCPQAGMPALAGLMTATCLAGSPPCLRGRADVSTSRRLDNIMVSPTAPCHPADHCSQVRVQSNGSGSSHTTAHVAHEVYVVVHVHTHVPGADVSTSRRLDNITASPTAPRHPADHCSQVRVQSNGSGLSHTKVHHILFTSSSGAMKNRAEQGARHIPWAPPACVLGLGPLDLRRLDFLTFDPVTCAKGATPPHPCLLRGRTCAEGCGSKRPGSRC
jgi:hypothetical protein